MSNPNPRVLVAFLILIAAALLAACGPQAPAGSAPAPTQAIPFVGGEASPVEQPTGAPVAAADSGAVDEYGIPVGFTDEGRPYRGRLDAPVVMEEFSDFQCPFCGRFSTETMPELLRNQIQAGDVVLIFHDFPLTQLHPQAAAAANAARCAGEAGATAYWAMHDRLFASIDEWANDSAGEVFRRYGDEIGLDADSFSVCLDEDRYAAEIEADVALGQSRGVSSTPTFYLNDQAVVGAYPLDYFNEAIATVKAGNSIAAEPEPAAEAPQPGVKPTPATIVVDDISGARGNPDAPVTIIEYTDYQCPYCARHHSDTLPRLLSDMVDTGRVYYMIKDFPLDNIHPEARPAAVAARCAGEQDAYWEMHDAIFAGQQEWAGTGAGARDVFARYAADLDLNADDFAACLDSGRYDAVIQANQDEGFRLGVNGTPAFFINGFPISGAQPYELFDYAVGLAEEGTLADAYVQREEAQAQPAEPQGQVEVDIEGAHSVGDPNAPVTIVEFTDFQCPFCSRHFAQTFPQIKANYIDTGKVRYVFKDFPLTSIHPEAPLAAEAARCAGEQDAYLDMHTALFEGQGDWSGRSSAGDVFAGYAEALGLDTAAFRECLDSGRYQEAVSADLEQGVSLGVNGTPAFFLNGYFLSGAQPYSVFQQAIDSLLADEG